MRPAQHPTSQQLPTRLFRADDLCRLQGEDLDRLTRLGVRTVVDLRRPAEVDARGRIPEAAGRTYSNVHVRHADWQPADFTAPDARTAYLVERYLEMADLGADGIGAALRLVAEPHAAPLVFHCVAGKDRTGLVAAFTLYLLGVSDEDIADDYALSELAEEPNWYWYAERQPHIRPKAWLQFAVSPRQAMLGFFDRLRATYGTIEEYLAGTGVTGEHVAAMRAHLLTGSPDPAAHRPRLGGERD